MPNNIELYNEGIRILYKHMGALKTEAFIAALLRERFDYTKWHQELAERTTKEEFDQWIEEAEAVEPFIQQTQLS